MDSLQLEGTNTAMMPGGQAEMCSDEGIPSNNHDSGYMETKNTMHKMCSKQVTVRTSMSQGAGQMSRLPLCIKNIVTWQGTQAGHRNDQESGPGKKSDEHDDTGRGGELIYRANWKWATQCTSTKP